MITDAKLLFSDAQAITAQAVSTNVVDLGAIANDIGVGEDLYVFVTVDVAFTDSGSNSTLTVALYGDSTTTFTPDGNTTLGTLPALAAAGSKYFYKLPPGIVSAVDALAYQYIALEYTPNNGNLSTGTVTAGICKDIDKVNYFASGFSVSGH